MASEMRIELIQVPVSDIDRAKSFYVDRVGFIADHDYQVSDNLRFVQLTPPGSACSIALTSGAHKMVPGSIEGLQMVVEDAEASRKELADRGVEVSDVQPFPWGNFVFFKDPDGNGWALQALTHRDGGSSVRSTGGRDSPEHVRTMIGPPRASLSVHSCFRYRRWLTVLVLARPARPLKVRWHRVDGPTPPSERCRY